MKKIFVLCTSAWFLCATLVPYVNTPLAVSSGACLRPQATHGRSFPWIKGAPQMIAGQEMVLVTEADKVRIERFLTQSLLRHFAISSIQIEHAARLVPISRRERVVVLGAGPCNDIPLDALADMFNDIVLVDINGSALESAKNRYRHNPDVYNRITIVISDLSQGVSPEAAGRADFVVSSMLLSQMVNGGVGRMLDDGTEEVSPAETYEDVIRQQRAHFAMCDRLLADGGVLYFSDNMTNAAYTLTGYFRGAEDIYDEGLLVTFCEELGLYVALDENSHWTWWTLTRFTDNNVAAIARRNKSFVFIKTQDEEIQSSLRGRAGISALFDLFKQLFDSC